jgi:hypothetical protein
MGAEATTLWRIGRIVVWWAFFCLFNSGTDDPSPPPMASSSDSSSSGSESTYVQMWVTQTHEVEKKTCSLLNPYIHTQSRRHGVFQSYRNFQHIGQKLTQPFQRRGGKFWNLTNVVLLESCAGSIGLRIEVGAHDDHLFLTFAAGLVL